MQHLILKALVIVIFSMISVAADASRYEIYEQNASGVVVIFSEDGIGSGVILSERGYVLTNWHVVDGQEDIQVICGGCMDTYEESVFETEVIKIDKTRDLALLKIINPPSTLTKIEVSQVTAEVGDEVHAIGHPEGEIWTYTQGYISQYRGDYEWSYPSYDDIEFVADVYQTQTPVSGGSSGGPLLNQFGNLIGINTFGNTEANGNGTIMNYSITVEEIIEFLTNK